MDCEFLSNDWLIRMQRDDTVHLTFGYGFDINNAIADRVGNDKVAQYEILARNNLPAIEHHFARIPSETRVDTQHLSQLDSSLSYVTKPVGGSSGDNIVRHPSLAAAIQHINSLGAIHESWSVSPYEQLLYERRFIVLDGEILLGYEKSDPHISSDGLVFFNLDQGARAKTIDPTDACTLRLAAIDIVGTTDGAEKIMEINSGIMCEAYARQSDSNYSEVQGVYRTIIQRVFAS